MRTEALDAVLAEIVDRWEIPGLAVGIVRAEAPVYTRCLGVQSVETGVPVSPDSIFCVASISKSFTATAVMQLVELGRLDLDAPVTRYLPYFRLADECSARITPRQILSHTSGMPDMEDRAYGRLVAHPEWDEGAAERYVRGLSGLKMIAEPGARFSYSNIAYNVLGDLIAKVSGLSFEDHLKAQVLLPAGMADSTFLPAEVARERLAMPHLRVPEMIPSPFYPYHRADAPASFLHATLGDMCRWLQTCLNGGMFAGKTVLSPAGLAQMWTPVARWGYPPLYEETGLGWTLGHIHGFKTVAHGGMGFGWTDFMVLLPEAGCAAVILCNEESFARGRTVNAVIAAMLGLEPQPGSVSWMVPIRQALSAGGMPAALDCLAELRRADPPGYEFEEDDLINLALQMETAGRAERAAEALELNLRVFPKSVETLIFLAGLDRAAGRLDQAREHLRQVLELDPGSAAAAEQLSRL